MNLEERIKAYGSAELLPKRINLKAGQLDLVYENGAIRWIKIGQTEVLRMIYSAVRDRNWGTIEPEIVSESIETTIDSFEIHLKVSYKAEPIHFVADYCISGKENTIRFEMAGIAQSDFLKNRIGFCVLHPIVECAGKSGKVSYPDGNISDFVFPEQISAHQPVKNMEGLEWEPISGVKAKLKFSGAVFEMEDQRNWTDASFKTYCTPLELPFPVKVKKGEKVSQVVELIVENETTQIKPSDKLVLTISPNLVSPLPELGTSISSRKELLTQYEVDLLKQLPFKHLRVEIKPCRPDFKVTLEKAKIEGEMLGWPLFVVLYLTNDYQTEYESFAQLSEKLNVHVSSIVAVGEDHLSFVSNDKLIAQIKKDFPDSKVGVGVNAYFAELNRTRPIDQDFISFTICPQVHAFDNSSLVENLAGQAEVIKSAKNLYPGKPLFVSPITLKQRMNVVATSDEAESEKITDGLPPSVDIRQSSDFAASWTLGSIKYLTQAGASLITYYETVGWKGFMQGEFAPTCSKFISEKAKCIFPIYHVLKDFSGTEKVVHSDSSHPLIFDGMVIQGKEDLKIFLFNFSEKDIEVSIEKDSPLDSKPIDNGAEEYGKKITHLYYTVRQNQ